MNFYGLFSLQIAAATANAVIKKQNPGKQPPGFWILKYSGDHFLDYKLAFRTT